MILAIITVAFHLLMPSGIVERGVKSLVMHFADLPDGCGMNFDITRLSWSETCVENISVTGLPVRVDCKSVTVRYSLLGLLRKELDGVSVAGLRADFSGVIPDDVRVNLVRSDVTVSANLLLSGGEYNGTIDGNIIGAPFYAELKFSPQKLLGSMSLQYEPLLANQDVSLPLLRVLSHFRVSAKNDIAVVADADMTLDGSSLNAHIDGSWSNGCAYAEAKLGETVFTEKERVVAAVMHMAGVTNFSPLISCKISGNASMSYDGTLPFWTANLNVADVDSSVIANDLKIGICGGKTRITASGIGSHFDIKPVRLSITNAVIGPVKFGRGHGTVMATDESLVMTEVSVSLCGGFVRVFSLSLNYAQLDAGFTLLLDNLELDGLIALIPNISGTATGHLFGKIPLRIVNGTEFRLRDAFIYAPPGEIGKIKLDNTEPVVNALASAGVPQDVCDNLGTALHDLDYDVFRIDLSAPRRVDGRLEMILKGKSETGKIVTPVDLDIGVSGPLEQLLNFGVKLSK